MTNTKHKSNKGSYSISGVNRRNFFTVLLAIAVLAGASCERRQALPAQSANPAPAAKTTAEPITIAEDREADDLARFLAGLPAREGSPYEPLEQAEGWVGHARESERLWSLFRRERHGSMTEFQRTELSGGPISGGALFYPFGGPDALTALTLFPEKSLYVLVGLEPPGTMPRWAQFHTVSLTRPLARMRSTTVSLLQRSFFITAEMDRQLRGQVTDGVLPVIMVQLVRTGHRIRGYRYVTLDAEGRLVERSRDAKDVLNRGVAISFEDEDDRQRRTLVFFSTNLATPQLKNNQPFLRYLESLEPVTSFFKSTSYMPHNAAFSLIREEVLQRSAAVVQDDSGIPFRFFDPNTWRVQLYGDYDKPYGSFRYLQQKDLKLAFQRKESVRKLSFPIGYGFKRIPSNLIVALKSGRG
jgi:hypothetical protein